MTGNWTEAAEEQKGGGRGGEARAGGRIEAGWWEQVGRLRQNGGGSGASMGRDGNQSNGESSWRGGRKNGRLYKKSSENVNKGVCAKAYLFKTFTRSPKLLRGRLLKV